MQHRALDRTRSPPLRSVAIILVGAAVALACSSSDDEPKTTLTREALRDPKTCTPCHAEHFSPMVRKHARLRGGRPGLPRDEQADDPRDERRVGLVLCELPRAARVSARSHQGRHEPGRAAFVRARRYLLFLPLRREGRRDPQRAASPRRRRDVPRSDSGPDRGDASSRRALESSRSRKARVGVVVRRVPRRDHAAWRAHRTDVRGMDDFALRETWAALVREVPHGRSRCTGCARRRRADEAGARSLRRCGGHRADALSRSRRANARRSRTRSMRRSSRSSAYGALRSGSAPT
jgi:hypothetical protein